MEREREIRTAAATVVASLLLAAPLAAQQRVSEERDVPRDGTVEVANLAGSVTVRGWDRPRLSVEGTVGEGTEGLEISRDGRRTTVKVELPEDHGRNGRSKEAHLEIRLPSASGLSVDAVSADVEVTGVLGSLELRSVSGDVTVREGGGRVHARSISGDVEVQGGSERVRASAASGDVTLRGAGGSVDASSISGSVDVEGGAVSDGNFKSTSGGIRFVGSFASGAAARFETVSGDVRLTLSRAISAHFEISTFSGDIDNELGPAARRKSRFGPGKELEFTAGGGGARVRVETLSGSVVLGVR